MLTVVSERTWWNGEPSIGRRDRRLWVLSLLLERDGDRHEGGAVQRDAAGPAARHHCFPCW